MVPYTHKLKHTHAHTHAHLLGKVSASGNPDFLLISDALLKLRYVVLRAISARPQNPSSMIRQ